MYPRSKLAISLSTVELNHGENKKFPEGPLEHRARTLSLSPSLSLQIYTRNIRTLNLA